MSLAREIARALGNGKEERNRDGWLTCCPVHGDKTPSMAIKDNDEGSVDVYCHTNDCDFKEIKDTLRNMGLLPEWKPDPSKATSTPAKSSSDEESFIWKMAGKDGLENAKKYLAGRGITLDLPVCLKWNSYQDKKSKDQVSMIVAAASKPTDKNVYAVQRLFIDLEDHKKTGAKMHGQCEGRGVWFDRKGDMTDIVVGEGIETTLSAMQATGKNGVATLSTSGMKSLVIPKETETLYILVDSDPVREKEAASMPGQKAAYKLAESFTHSREGRTAFLVSPDDTCFSDKPGKLDFNDLLKADNTGEGIRSRFDKSVKFDDLEWSPPGLDEQENDEQSADDDGEFPPATLKALIALNKEYAAVKLGGDFRIACEGFDPIAMKNTLSFMKKTSFFDFYANKKVPVYTGPNKDIIEYKPLAKIWHEWWQDRRTYWDVQFDPSEQCGPNVYNLFKGFPLTPKEGDWSLMRQHIFKVICAGNTEYFEYVMAWMARAVQDPGGEKPGVAVVLKGGKGIGKGVFVNYFGAIFGEAFLPIADSESFTGRFNMHLSKSLVVFLDEAVWGGDKKAEGKLKQLITEPTILFEPKGIDSLTMRNFINVIIASNEEWVVPATGDERRFFVLQPSAEFQQDTNYFGKIFNERKNGGPEAMMYDLLQYDYTAVDLRSAPKTDGLSEQVQASLPSVLEFWYSVIEREYILTDKDTGRPTATSLVDDVAPINDLWPGAAFKHELYAEYINWCKIQNERFLKNSAQFWKETFAWMGGKPGKRIQRRDSRNKYMDACLLPTIEDAKLAFSTATNINFGDQDPEEMASDGYLSFDSQF